MALFSALIAYLGRQLSSLVQAVLGWSVTALFGRLPSAKQTALSVALLASLLWPVFVVGVVIPAVSAWAFAFVPLQKWIGDDIVRWVTLGIAIALPLGVGAITRWVAPVNKGSLVRTVVSGYALTIGYAVACLITAVTVPLVKVASAARQWSDEHVYVQPREGEFDAALRELVSACEAAGISAVVAPVPGRMLLATRVLKWFARSALHPIVAEEPKMVRAAHLQVYLYPADLLIRGDKDDVARVRAALTRTWLERYAFIVSDPGAQELQEEIQRMWQVVQRHRDPREIGRMARSRLREIAHDLDRTAVPFEQWVTLDRSLHRVERALYGGEDVLRNDLAVHDARDGEDREESAMQEQPKADAVAEVRDTEEATAELIREALDETRHLVRLEVALAREELKAEINHAKLAGISIGSAAAAAVSSFTMFMVAIALAFHWSWLAALIIGGILLCLAGAMGFAGWMSLPKKPLAETRERLESDLKQLKERIA